jgi:hypothetical protein
MNTDDISIDVESLSHLPDAAVIAIGAVQFDRTTGKQGATFYREIELNSAIRAGHVSGQTVSWWMRQSDEARQLFAESRESLRSPLATVLQEFGTFCRSVKGGVPRPWGNGIATDISWIELAYKNGSVGLTVPWHYRTPRDMRTIVELAEELAGFDKNVIEHGGVLHNALDDAIYQARVISAAYAALKVPQAIVKKALAKAKTVAPEEDDL